MESTPGGSIGGINRFGVVVWSGGLLAEPSLNVVRIDGLGRPMFPERLILDGDYPVFAKTLDNQIIEGQSTISKRITA